MPAEPKSNTCHAVSHYQLSHKLERKEQESCSSSIYPTLYTTPVSHVAYITPHYGPLTQRQIILPAEAYTALCIESGGYM